jgi:hypothetical protein
MDAPPEPAAPAPRRMSRAGTLVAWVVGTLLLAAVAALALSFVIKDEPPAVRTHSTPKPPSMAAPAGIRVGASCDGFFTTRVMLQWRPSASPDVDGYAIYRSQSPDGPFTKVDLVAARASTTYVNSELATGTSYFFVIRATSGSRMGPFSPPAQIRTPSICLF